MPKVGKDQDVALSWLDKHALLLPPPQADALRHAVLSTLKPAEASALPSQRGMPARHASLPDAPVSNTSKPGSRSSPPAPPSEACTDQPDQTSGLAQIRTSAAAAAPLVSAQTRASSPQPSATQSSLTQVCPGHFPATSGRGLQVSDSAHTASHWLAITVCQERLCFGTFTPL